MSGKVFTHPRLPFAQAFQSCAAWHHARFRANYLSDGTSCSLLQEAFCANRCNADTFDFLDDGDSVVEMNLVQSIVQKGHDKIVLNLFFSN